MQRIDNSVLKTGEESIAGNKTFTGNVNITGELLKNGNAINITTPWVPSGNNQYYNSGNIGIGTSNPSATLEINGNLKVNSCSDDINEVKSNYPIYTYRPNSESENNAIIIKNVKSLCSIIAINISTDQIIV